MPDVDDLITRNREVAAGGGRFVVSGTVLDLATGLVETGVPAAAP